MVLRPAVNDKNPGDDAIFPFQLDRLAIRGRVARLDCVLDKILSGHSYPPSVSALVAEAALITAMVGDALKLRGRFSLQARGDGAVKLIATDYFAPTTEGGAATMRAYAHFEASETPETSSSPALLLGEGVMAMTIEQGEYMKPYQGLTPLTRQTLEQGGLSAGAETYFAQSEQLATKFKISVGAAQDDGGAPRWRAGGVMLQHLGAMGEGAQKQPEAPQNEDGLLSAADVAEMSDNSDDWRHAVLVLDTVEEIELIGPHVTPESLLIRLFHEVGPRSFPAQAVEFGCSCSEEAVLAVLQKYERSALVEMAGEDGLIDASCQFCSAVYKLSPDIGRS